jgi:hypothetical protein
VPARLKLDNGHDDRLIERGFLVANERLEYQTCVLNRSERYE